MKQGSFGLKCISVWQIGTALTKFFSTVRYALHLPFAMSFVDSYVKEIAIEKIRTNQTANTVGTLSQNNDGALWRLPTVLANVPVSRSHWWAGVASGRYPSPVRLSVRCVAWRSADIRALIASF
jgi:predicted DNA-binding transcriptional regulator AlpA